MIILLGQSVQDSANGKDVVQAFAVRMSLFIAVTLYACLMVQVAGSPAPTLLLAHSSLTSRPC